MFVSICKGLRKFVRTGNDLQGFIHRFDFQQGFVKTRKNLLELARHCKDSYGSVRSCNTLQGLEELVKISGG